MILNKQTQLFFFTLTIILSSTSTSTRTRKKKSNNFDLINYNVEHMYNIQSNDSVQRNKNFHRQLSVTNLSEFVARIRGGVREAKELADRFNLRLVKQVFADSNYFLFEKETQNTESQFKDSKTSIRIRRSLEGDVIEGLETDPMIEWIQEQVPKIRKKRDYVSYDWGKHVESKPYNDPMWDKLWYINPKNKHYQNSMRVKEAWEQGYTGKGVVVTILDDGLEWDHPDLIKNYDFRASLDINDGDNDPKPRYDRYNYNKHGTRCAGEIAAVADNSVCSVGVAYNSQIGGIRMLDGEVTDLVEATALSYNRDYIDIYSASWGPDDDGKTVDGPGFLALKAIEDGIKYGRRGLGSIYVWASGNGGKDDDNCNCDGYTNSIYTISVSSATQNGQIPWYSEACSSTIASTFSSGSYEESQIITTDLRKSCTEAHTGTSASAPLAAGIIALTLEANPDLSWRDVQHIIVKTAKQDNLSSSDWHVNGANYRVSHSFGFGMMDALGMVELAKKWINVPSQEKCIIESSMNGKSQKPILIPRGDRLIIELFSTGCKGAKNEINFLEHVQAVISVQSNSRGTLAVYLRSPMGTNSTLLDRRMLDQSTESFDKWPFTTVHMWGEQAKGKWSLEIRNNAKNTTYLSLNLILYGTKTEPQKRSILPESNKPATEKGKDQEKAQDVKNQQKKQADQKSEKSFSVNDQRNTDKNVFYNYQQSIIDWKKLKDMEYQSKSYSAFYKSAQPTETPSTSTRKQLKFLSGLEEPYYLIAASNQKSYAENLFDNNNAAGSQRDYEDEYDDEYYPEYDVHNVKKEEVHVSDKALLQILSTTKESALMSSGGGLADTAVRPVVNNIQGAQEHKSPFFTSVVVDSGAARSTGGLLLNAVSFFLFYIMFLFSSYVLY